MIKDKYNVVLGFITSNVFNLLIIALGCFLRINHYFDNYSFWVDEAGTAVSIVSRSFHEIIHHIEIFPTFAKPPLGFLLIEKFMVVYFGNTELNLRFFPFICSLLSLFVFYSLLKKTASKASIPLALTFLAITNAPIVYAAELKQYSCDLLFGLLILNLFADFKDKNFKLWHYILLGLLGGSILWISNASLFILGAVGIASGLYCCFQKQWSKLPGLIMMGLLWLASFVLLYKISLVHMVDNDELKASWTGAFLTAPLFSKEGWQWITHSFSELFLYPIGIYQPLLGFILFVGGCVVIFKRQKLNFFMLIIPVLLLLLAGILGKYPFRGRVVLFIVPVFYLFVSEGVVFAIKRFKKVSLIVGAVLLWIILSVPIDFAQKYYFTERSAEYNRQVLTYFKEHYKPGDFIFLNTAAQYPFWYYASQLEFSSMLPMEFLGHFQNKTRVGQKVGQIFDGIMVERGKNLAIYKYVYHSYDQKGNFRNYYALKNVSKEQFILEGAPHYFKDHKRVWVYFSRVQEPKMKEIILKNFDMQGKRLDQYEQKEASIYLYDLSQG